MNSRERHPPAHDGETRSQSVSHNVPRMLRDGWLRGNGRPRKYTRKPFRPDGGKGYADGGDGAIRKPSTSSC